MIDASSHAAAVSAKSGRTPPGFIVEGSARFGDEQLFPKLRLEVKAGAWTSLLGPSGVGKTTLLRLVAGLDAACTFEGAIRVSDGRSLEQRVAYMGQSDLLAPWLDVLGNVTLGQKLRGDAPDVDRALTLIGRVGLSAHIYKRPHALSGGERQRAALARTLMEDRPVVLLDEPFSSLDANTRADMQELAGELLRGKTVLLVTHDPTDAVRLSHRIYLMGGRGLSEMSPPSSDPVRPFDDPDVLAAQADMLRRLRSDP